MIPAPTSVNDSNAVEPAAATSETKADSGANTPFAALLATLTGGDDAQPQSSNGPSGASTDAPASGSSGQSGGHDPSGSDPDEQQVDALTAEMAGVQALAAQVALQVQAPTDGGNATAAAIGAASATTAAASVSSAPQPAATSVDFAAVITEAENAADSQAAVPSTGPQDQASATASSAAAEADPAPANSSASAAGAVGGAPDTVEDVLAVVTTTVPAPAAITTADAVAAANADAGADAKVLGPSDAPSSATPADSKAALLAALHADKQPETAEAAQPQVQSQPAKPADVAAQSAPDAASLEEAVRAGASSQGKGSDSFSSDGQASDPTLVARPSDAASATAQPDTHQSLDSAVFAGLVQSASSSESAAAPQESAPVPLAQLPDEVARHIVSLSHDNGGEVQIRLDPPGLGGISVQVVVHNGTVQAQITADRSDVARSLQSQISDLTKTLEQRGLSLGQFNVSAQSDTGSRRHDAAPNQNRRRVLRSDSGGTERVGNTTLKNNEPDPTLSLLDITL